MEKRYFSVREAAERLAVSHDTVLRLVHDGTLPAVRVSDRLYRIPRPALDRFESAPPLSRRRVVTKRVASGIDMPAAEQEQHLQRA